MLPTIVSIGQMAKRTGLSISAIRFYENAGLILPERSTSGQRRYPRADLRRLSFIMVMQRLGFSIAEIRAMLDELPNKRTPTKADWTKLSHSVRAVLDERIAIMQQLRANLDGCIGCGCLSLARCKLYNKDDEKGRSGVGPRSVLG